MQAIKALVIGMGLVLVAGIGLLGYGLYNKSAKRPSAVSSVGDVPAATAFGTVQLPVAPGARLLHLQEAGGRLAVLVDEGGTQRIIVLDPVAGSVLGSFVPAAQP